MENLTSSRTSGIFVGRIIVLIPQLDYCMIEQVKDGVLTEKGNPAPTQVEILAVRRAREICHERGIARYVILTDSQGALNMGIEGVRYLEPGKVHYGSLFLDRMMKRAQNLRQS